MKFDSLVYKIHGASVAGKQNIQHYTSTVRPLLTSKACPVIQEDSYRSATLNESGIDNWTLQNALLCLLTLKLSAPRLSKGMLFYAGALLNVWNPHSSSVSTAFFEKPRLPLHSHEARRESLLRGCKCKLVLGTTKGIFLSFRMRLNRFQGRSGVVKGKPWPPPVSSLYCPALPAKPSFSLSHWGLPNPQHLSHFTTLMVRASEYDGHACSSVRPPKTASRHLKVLSCAILSIYLFNLFVCNLLQLITGVFALSSREYLYG